MLNPLLKVAQYMYFQEKLGEYNSISYSGMLPHKNKVDDIIMFSMVLIKIFISVSYFIFDKKKMFAEFVKHCFLLIRRFSNSPFPN